MNQEEEQTAFVICIRNTGCEDLELSKMYQAVPDSEAAKSHLLRVIDESGESYLYPADYFIQVNPHPADDHVISVTASPSTDEISSIPTQAVESEDDLLPEYDLADLLKHAVRGKYA